MNAYGPASCLSIGLTGSRGVLGSRICEAAAALGHRVREFPGDIRDASAFRDWLAEEQPDCVVHAAAIVPVSRVASDVAESIAVNVGGTASIAAACARAETRLVYISTSHVYAPSGSPLGETDDVAPSTLYGLTKLQGEQWCEAFVREPLILRLFSYFDARQDSAYLVPGLIERIADSPDGGTLKVHGSNNVRDIATASWLAGCIVRLIATDATGVINCGTGSGFTVGEIARTTLESSGRPDIKLELLDDPHPNSLIARTDRMRMLLQGVDDFDLGAALGSLFRATEMN